MKLILYFSPFILMLFQCKDSNIKSYEVRRINEELNITGKGDDPLWKNAVELTDFIYPWEDAKPSFTSFKALHSRDSLYCLFDVKDEEVLIYVDTNEESEAIYSDRAEIFLRKDPSMSPYYCLEIDPIPRIFDCKGEFHLNLDKDWTWPKGHLIVKTDRKEDGYTIEIAISKKSLRDLELLNDNKIEAGLYRAECVKLYGMDATFRWISWIKPDSEKPDFHIPSSFGILKLN